MERLENKIKDFFELPVFLHAGISKQCNNIKSHNHHGLELILVLEGIADITIGREKLSGGPGSIFVIPPEVYHDQNTSHVMRSAFITCHISPSMFDHTFRNIDTSKAKDIQRWFLDICNYYSKFPSKSFNIIEGLLLVVIRALSEFEKSQQDKNDLHPAVAKALEYMQKDLTQNLPANKIAKAAGISYGRLAALFQEKFGTGPSKYHQQLRLNHALYLLHNSYLSISDIAEDCGYDDPNYFGRIFKKYYGVTPSAARKNFIKNSNFTPKLFYEYQDKSNF